MATSRLPGFAAAWLRQRNDGDAAVAAVKRAELRDLNDAEALRLADALLAATPTDALPDERKRSSGLVEQQRLFALARR